VFRKTLPAAALLTAAALIALVFWHEGQHSEKITIAHSAIAGPAWPLYAARDGGYYARYGLDVNLTYAVHPVEIAMVVSGQAAMAYCGLEQAMQASSRDGSLVVYASPFKKGLLALMANSRYQSVRDLKGKRIGVGQFGDTPHTYAIGLLVRFGLTPRDVEWVIAGAGGSERAAALQSGRVDATFVSAPAYFRLEDRGYRNLGNIIDYDDLHAPFVFLFKKAYVTAHPRLAELLIKADAEAIKRLYEDTQFAVQSYLHYNREDPADIERILDLYRNLNIFQRAPYILRPAVQYMLDHPIDGRTGAIMRNFDFTTVLDNSIVDKLVREGFFEQLFGLQVKAEQEQKQKIAFQ
jgi:ABC-type nitrate/sulfonate/bicarbonate transport system substrate-binding protein